MSADLLERVLAEAPTFPFVALLHWLERLLDVQLASDSPRPSIALRHDAALAFQASDVRDARLAQAPGAPPRVAVTTCFAGLSGAASPLPPLLLEALALDDDVALPEHALLDALHHRLLALFYQGMRETDLTRCGDDAPVLDWLLQLAGLPVGESARLTVLPRRTLLRLAPLRLLYPANAARLRVALGALLDDMRAHATVEVREHAGGFVSLPPSGRSRLGVDLRLGATSALGARCRCAEAAISVSLGPLSQADCALLSPGGARASELSAIVRLLVPETISVAVTLQPAYARAPALGRGAQLSRDAWLSRRGAAAPLRFTLA